MEQWLTDAESIAASQSSTLSAANKENDLPVFSPRKTEALYTQRQRRPPTITPKRFSRFFTPRPSGRSRQQRQNRLGSRLQDVTFNGANGVPSLAIPTPPDTQQAIEPPAKRHKGITDPSDDAPFSSPIKHCPTASSDRLRIYEDLLSDTDSSEDEAVESLITEPALPVPIRRLAHRSRTHRLLVRSFGDLECDSRGLSNRGFAGSRSARDYVTLPTDIYNFHRHTALPFCATPCNQNSLVAIGDETGTVHMIDTATGTDFQQPHVSIKAHRNAIMDMSFSSCDYLLATTSGDQTVRIVDVQTQQVVSALLGHLSSIKQVHFRPENDKLLTTSARDGFVNIWDLRCSGNAKQSLRLGYTPPTNEVLPPAIYPYDIMLAGPAHRTTCAREVIDPYKWPADNPGSRSGVSITAIQHLTGSRSHLLLSATEQNSSLKLYDLRVAGRNTKSEKYGFEIPVSCTPAIRSHLRPKGVSALALSSDGARAYSVCKDSTVWVYSTQHLILGNAPEMVDTVKRTRLMPPDHMKDALGPLYGFRHPKLRVGTFYTRAAVRKTGPDQEEMLAVGSGEACPVLFPLNERQFRGQQPSSHADERDRISRRLFTESEPTQASPPIYHTGTALLHGHNKDVTSLAFAHGGELVTIADDFSARCWRQDKAKAHELRHGTHNKWKHGWADASRCEDDDDDSDLE